MLLRAFAGQAFLLAVLGVALFVPAGTLAYWQGWVVLAVFEAASTVLTIDLARRDPALLQRRTRLGPLAERSGLQKLIQVLSSLGFVAMFVVAALDHRAGWSRVPVAIVIASDALLVIGYWIVFRVFRANTYTSAVVEVVPAQRVIDTGPYAHVRHPMYAGALLMVLGIPLALGSWWSFLAAATIVVVIVVRLLDEERTLAAELPGYTAYRERVRYRLVPGVW